MARGRISGWLSIVAIPRHPIKPAFPGAGLDYHNRMRNKRKPRKSIPLSGIVLIASRSTKNNQKEYTEAVSLLARALQIQPANYKV